MTGVRAATRLLALAWPLAGLLACSPAFSAEAPVAAPAASAVTAPPQDGGPSAPARAAPSMSSPPPPDIPAPLATASAPTVPVADSVIGGDRVDRVQVTDPFIELHTGPGRGYPVFFVAARGEWIAIELRHTEWFKVRTAGGKEGWVHRKQLQTTLTEGGDRQAFHDPQLDDYLQRRVDIGAGYGRFHGDPLDKFWVAYRLSDTLSIESTYAQVQGVFSGTSVWHVNLQAEPWSDQRFSPFAGIGIGRFKNTPNRSLVDAVQTRARLSDAMIGAHYHLTDRFVLRVDYAIYTAFVADTRSTEYRAVSAGISFFF